MNTVIRVDEARQDASEKQLSFLNKEAVRQRTVGGSHTESATKQAGR
jgi:hypothetical protein